MPVELPREPERRRSPEPAESIRRAIFDDGQEVGRSGGEPRESVPGTNDLLKRSAGHMIFGSRECGKTWVMLLIATAAANAGEKVLYLDLENGEPEMRERVEAVLDATGWDDPLESGALRIVSFPTLSRNWKPEDWAEAMSGFTILALDPLRDVLEAHGLDEKDGFGALVGSRIAPLRARGITVLVGANVGHEHKERPRGDSRQEDALPQVYKCVLVEDFDHVLVGRVRLVCKRSRYGDKGREWEARVGGEVFELPATPTESPKLRAAKRAAEKEDNFRRVVVAVLREAEGRFGRERLLRGVRDRGIKVRAAKAREWLSKWSSEPGSDLDHNDQGYELVRFDPPVPTPGPTPRSDPPVPAVSLEGYGPRDAVDGGSDATAPPERLATTEEEAEVEPRGEGRGGQVAPPRAARGLELGDPSAGWTPPAADGFLARACETFPGATELSPTGSSWVARPHPHVEPTPEQCADPLERLQLWQEHGVHWVRTPPPDPPAAGDGQPFGMDDW
jgi:hypothetical protein